MTSDTHRQKLIHILQLAYSGEKAASLAYSGHWRSLRQGTERDTIKRIEQEEVEHRLTVGRMLKELNASPALWREILMHTIGTIACIGCFISGWFLPMYFAGKLENENVREYDVAAGHAHALGLFHLLPELKQMSLTEAEHELFFSQCIINHWLLSPAKVLFRWDPVTVIAAHSTAQSEIR
jgi:demethoxyubiquinone hydroxylase (CLK1/Coq7/Cat5 family)